jgi:betaine-aldehyde dehydrogenase
VTLELGGKSANVVFADADLDAAAAAAPYAVFDNSVRTAAPAVACSWSARPTTRSSSGWCRVGRRHVGDPLADGTVMGPLVTAAHRDKVAATWRASTSPPRRGAGRPRLLVPVHDRGAGRPDERALPRRDLRTRGRGRALRRRGRGDRHRQRLAYGLSGSIWSGDGGRALRVARALDAGTLSVNSNSSVRVSTPFGGFKQSGLGRELSMQALAAYSELKTIFVSTAPRP